MNRPPEYGEQRAVAFAEQGQTLDVYNQIPNVRRGLASLQPIGIAEAADWGRFSPRDYLRPTASVFTA